MVTCHSDHCCYYAHLSLCSIRSLCFYMGYTLDASYAVDDLSFLHPKLDHYGYCGHYFHYYDYAL